MINGIPSKMIRPVILLLTIFLEPTFPLDRSSKKSPLRVIDIFTNYPSTEEIFKEYNVIKQHRQESNHQPLMNASSRSFSDYDDYYSHYKPYDDYYDKGYYNSDRRHYTTEGGDVLESEFGVFDARKQGYADRYNDKYIYVQGEKYTDYVPSFSYNHYTISKPQTEEDNAENFKDKLNQFIAEVEKRPSFHTKKNSTSYDIYTKPNVYADMYTKPNSYADKFNFQPNDKLPEYFQVNNEYGTDTNEVEDPIQSEYGEIVTRPSAHVPKQPTKPPKRGIITPIRKPIKQKIPVNQSQQILNSQVITITESAEQVQDVPKQNNTRQKLTNILRKYLVKMHKNKKNGGRKNRHFKNKDRMGFGVNKFFDTTKTQFNTDYTVDEGPKQKFLLNPLQSIKNKTMKFANKFLSLFTVIQFANFKCQASTALSQYEGTCYLASECNTMNGEAMGNCANGVGVCCVFRGTCGGVGSNNCTYFESPGYPNYFPDGGGIVTPGPDVTTSSTTSNPLTPDPRLPEIEELYMEMEGRQDDNSNALSCIFKVFMSSDSIKQMRIDFIDLELRGPTDGACLNERLVITGSGIGTMVPVICGYNTGQHVYVDVSMLTGPLQISILANTIERKRYKLRICQYDDGCSGQMNCLQYYTGISGMIQSFNYDQAASFSRSTPQYLNNLNYAICIRREPGYCTITYRNVGPDNVVYPFQIRNYEDDGSLTVPVGQAGVGVLNCPDDFIVINGIRLCGDRLNDGSVIDNFSMNAPVTDNSGGPIIIPVRTSTLVNGRGFKLFYMQNKCGAMMPGMTGGVPDPRYRTLD